MKVLLTRPEGRNHQLAAALEHRGVPYLVTPLLDINLYSEPFDQSLIDQADIIIFISTNAVRYAFEQRPHQWPSAAKYIAVGQATQVALDARGITSIAAPSDNQKTEGLLSLPVLKTPRNKNIVIIRGVGGRECLAQSLSQQGANMNYWQVYQRSCPIGVDSKIVQKWQLSGIDTIVVTSGEILLNLCKLVSNTQCSWLRACRIIVPSTRVAEIARSHFLENIVIAAGANAAAILAALPTQD
ncbi:uroporphyrinogen-III synthase [Shewanella gelidii]|uniref:Uroporphyrinogen-III synthase n=1 Tax=Shewanella gelidii TaxID=1642821 RepID=A0A917JUV3_9GAMM|nr:uroporphyrinogen-III synthase [Shewanella gelidii]MCL1098702.1 uroporphyrinogen-III synthase [Shewanella gelidii]GGI88248.1 uroporphyrinogen III methyltransferase [Shewanella gelidii]